MNYYQWRKKAIKRAMRMLKPGQIYYIDHGCNNFVYCWIEYRKGGPTSVKYVSEFKKS